MKTNKQNQEYCTRLDSYEEPHQYWQFKAKCSLSVG